MNTRETEVIRGRQAQEVLNSPIFIEAWNKVGEALQAQRRKCPIKDTDQAIKLVLAEQMLMSVKSAIFEVMNTGKLAEEQIRLESERESWLMRLKRNGFSR